MCACLCEWTCVDAWPCVGVRPHSECWTLGTHPRACVCRIQQPYRVHVRFLLALLIDLHASKRQIWPIAGLARGWIQTTRIVRCVILAPINLRRSRNLPRRRLSSRAERRQKPKSAPDDAPVRLRWPVPGTSDTVIVHSLARFQSWQRPGGEPGGAVRGGWGLDLAVPNLGERRRLARSRTGESHAVVYDGPIPPESAGTCRRAALGGGWLQEFRASIREKNKTKVSCTPCENQWKYPRTQNLSMRIKRI